MKHSRTSYNPQNYKDDLKAVFHLDITSDTPSIHPSQFCEKCKVVVSKSKKATTEGGMFPHSVKTYKWLEHESEPSGCSVCTQPVGGRPRKFMKNRGRPSATSAHSMVSQVKQLMLAT